MILSLDYVAFGESLIQLDVEVTLRWTSTREGSNIIMHDSVSGFTIPSARQEHRVLVRAVRGTL